jgi:hypothetical protein
MTSVGVASVGEAPVVPIFLEQAVVETTSVGVTSVEKAPVGITPVELAVTSTLSELEEDGLVVKAEVVAPVVMAVTDAVAIEVISLADGWFVAVGEAVAAI